VPRFGVDLMHRFALEGENPLRVPSCLPAEHFKRGFVQCYGNCLASFGLIRMNPRRPPLQGKRPASTLLTLDR
jgi:hypothetical protein